MSAVRTIFVLCLLGVHPIIAQEHSDTPCKQFERSDSTHLIVSGMIDHNELDPIWVKETISPDSINQWCTRRTEAFLNDFFPDSSYTDSIFISMKTTRQQFVSEKANQHNRWLHEAFAKLMFSYRTGDSILYYSTPEDYWWALAGQDGLLLIRKCTVVVQIILAQS